ncbi:beta-eliminating lyase-related protein [Chelatococcus sp. SYSU_G07232]|uniref:L-threonine aldolase n=1 Tax=Chelatococcus albus TaxID=3047466 RepID=A0ABT7AG35_9HYPH|nr:beta-eliminating lyase-related protein [Chelatococcus sp. SYSU_G07232]MDJ1158311.1 beta-eliminating lyase-related protein [Chelatococcus sp. SYSU_G07232]
MNFASDNWAGAAPRVLEAVARVNEGAMRAYGGDEVTARVKARLCDVFERDLSVFLVVTGTAANALSLATLAQSWRSVLCHAEAHVVDVECGATEFYSGGAKLVGLPGVGGKVPLEAVARHLAVPRRVPHQMIPAALSLTQSTELGTVYSVDEIGALAELAHAHGLGVHLDGARFANALVRLGATPAEMTWRAGVDILSFGGTKNGCIAAEAVIVFDAERAGHIAERRMRGGHLLSKSRFVAAQLESYLAADHWLDLAAHANAAAARLAAGLARLGIRIPLAVEANQIFPILPAGVDAALRAAGAAFHPWTTASLPEGTAIGEDEVLVRLVTSFATRDEEVDRFLAVAAQGMREVNAV